MQCFRCGDTVFAKLDKAGYAHFEWRSTAASVNTRETLRKIQEKVGLSFVCRLGGDSTRGERGREGRREACTHTHMHT